MAKIEIRKMVLTGEESAVNRHDALNAGCGYGFVSNKCAADRVKGCCHSLCHGWYAHCLLCEGKCLFHRVSFLFRIMRV